jgi:hypothetical protein
MFAVSSRDPRGASSRIVVLTYRPTSKLTHVAAIG